MRIIKNLRIIKKDKRKEEKPESKRAGSPNMSPITLLPKSDGYAKTKAENKIKKGNR